jgi:hypothetical protein
VADCTEVGPVSGEDDLKKAVASLAPENVAGKLVLRRSNATIQIWTSAAKGANNALLAGSDYDAEVEGNGKKTWNLPADLAAFNAVKNSLYVEGAGSGVAEVSLTLEVGGHAAADVVRYTPIAALCGAQPTVEQRVRFEGWFANLAHCEWSVTAPNRHFY